MSLRSSIYILFLIFVGGLSPLVLTAQTSVGWENSFEQSQVLTFFNPDLKHDDQYLQKESERVAAYFVENSSDLPTLLKNLGLELTEIRRRHPSLGQEEFHRRLKPFIEALNQEIESKNKSVDGLRQEIAGYSAIAGLLLALGVDFLVVKKLKKRDPLKKKVKRTLCVGMTGCACGAILGFSAAHMVGRKIPLVSEREPRLSFVSSDETKDSTFFSSSAR